MIFGLGIDMIEVRRIEKQVTGGSRFAERIFTPREIAYCESKKRRMESYAARFAAKEAFFKALGTGWRGGLAFNEIEVVNDSRGKPGIILHGKAKRAAAEEGINDIVVSLSHLKEYAAAVVILGKY